MKNSTVSVVQPEEAILAYEISDDALETAAGTENQALNFTLGACTALSSCPD